MQSRKHLRANGAFVPKVSGVGEMRCLSCVMDECLALPKLAFDDDFLS